MKRFGNFMLLMTAIMGLVVLPGCAGLAQGISGLSEQLRKTESVVGQAGENAGKAIENGKAIIAEGEKIVDEMKEMEKEARKKADVDGSGDIDSIQEYLLYGSLLAAGGSGIFAERQRRMNAARRKEDELADLLRKVKEEK